jgi:anti-sigma factor RsiW
MRPENPDTCSEILEWIEPYLDGDLEGPLAQRVRWHLEGRPGPRGADPGCAGCRRELRRAERIRYELGRLAEERCPDSVTATVMEAARRGDAPAESGARSRTLAFPAPPRWLQAGALAAAAATLLWLGVQAIRTPEPEPAAVHADLSIAEYSPQELARAEQELRLALGYVAAIGRRSGVALRDDVLVDDVLAPSAEALERAFAAPPLPWRER